MEDIFEYENYEKYLNDWIDSRPRKGRGIKLHLSKYLKIPPGQISKVLGRDLHLTLDQAANLIEYLGLTETEGNYFLGLVEFARAGSLKLKEIVQKRLDTYKEIWGSPSRIGLDKKAYSQEDMEIYFSSYLYMAIELITFLDGYQTPDPISKYFNISKKKTLEILSFLVKLGAMEKNGDKYELTGETVWIDLSKRIGKINHTNWRNRAIASLDYDEDIGFHREINFAIERKDIPKIKRFLTDTILELNEKYLGKDTADTICSFCLDLFEIK